MRGLFRGRNEAEDSIVFSFFFSSMALFRQFCSLEKANSSRKTNVYRCLTCRKYPGYYSSRFNDQFSPSLPNLEVS